MNIYMQLYTCVYTHVYVYIFSLCMCVYMCVFCVMRDELLITNCDQKAEMFYSHSSDSSNCCGCFWASWRTDIGRPWNSVFQSVAAWPLCQNHLVVSSTQNLLIKPLWCWESGYKTGSPGNRSVSWYLGFIVLDATTSIVWKGALRAFKNVQKK